VCHAETIGGRSARKCRTVVRLARDRRRRRGSVTAALRGERARQFRIGRRDFRGRRGVRGAMCGTRTRISRGSACGTSIAIAPASRVRERTMTLKLGIRDGAISAAVFAGVLFMLVSTDPRVHDHVSDLFGGHIAVGPWGDRVSDLGSALWMAVKDQSIDNAPLLVFATVGTVLTIFMFKS
jgi:hypothetical protein